MWRKGGTMILIAGGGIAGMVMGLTLHQLGLPFRVYERVAEPRPLGVGIISVMPRASWRAAPGAPRSSNFRL